MYTYVCMMSLFLVKLILNTQHTIVMFEFVFTHEAVRKFWHIIPMHQKNQGSGHFNDAHLVWKNGTDISKTFLLPLDTVIWLSPKYLMIYHSHAILMLSNKESRKLIIISCVGVCKKNKNWFHTTIWHSKKHVKATHRNSKILRQDRLWANKCASLCTNNVAQCTTCVSIKCQVKQSTIHMVVSSILHTNWQKYTIKKHHIK